MNEAEDLVLLNELGTSSRTMLFEPHSNVIGHADVQGPVMTACEDVDVVAALAHGSSSRKQR